MGHKHKWMIIKDDGISAICYADEEAGKGVLTLYELLTWDLPELCVAKLTRREIEERLNSMEVEHGDD